MKPKGSSARKSRQQRPSRSATPRGSLWLYGKHAVLAALLNPARPIRKLIATENALEWLAGEGVPPTLLARAQLSDTRGIDHILPDGAAHQGLAMEVDPLPRARLKQACTAPKPGDLVLVLDQITDPHNIGALLRTAAAFNARAIIVQERRTPPLDGALAKAAVGALEKIPCILTVNIARALEALGDLGWYRVGLAGDEHTQISAIPKNQPLALVLGAEGTGLRPLVAQNCDVLAQIPISTTMESLNVSNAGAIALYEARRQ